MAQTAIIGEHTYGIEIDGAPPAPFAPATGIVRLMRDDCMIEQWEYDCAAARKRAIESAREKIRERQTNHWSWTLEPAPELWRAMTLYCVGIRPDGATGPVTSYSHVLARLESILILRLTHAAPEPTAIRR